MVYSMIVNPDSLADTDLFFLNPVTGVLSLRKVWDRGEKKEFRVSSLLPATQTHVRLP